MIYAEYRPPHDLAPWVACFWRINGCASGATSFQHRVLPDGCADLLFDLSAGGAIKLVGPMSTAQVVALSGSVDVLGVRLRPGAVTAFSGLRADELLDVVVPFSLSVSAEHVAEAGLRLVFDALRAHVAALDEPDPVTSYALGRWVRAESHDFPPVSILTRDVGLSERAFERRFLANVGLRPVSYRRLARLRTVFRLHAAGARGWAPIAATTGFSDQAHLVRDCRAFTGLTPTEWAATQAARAGFVQDGAVTTV
jgi:AraC-like DNA-binding protein